MDSAAVTEFFSLDDSPPKPSANANDTVRDHYGFTIPADYHELYRVYSPVWEQEEMEREVQWCQFLIDLAHLNADDGKFANLAELCADYLQDAVTIARHEQGPPSPHRQKLDALVLGGIPFTVRGSVWTVFLDTSVRKQRNYYNDLVKRCLGDLQYRGQLELDELRQQAAVASQALQDAAALHGLPAFAAVTEKALSTWQANSKVWLTQIEKDLPRTFPGLMLMELSGRPALRRVLAAYSLHNSRVGYCQGLNFVAGTLLLFLDEEDAFWCLCALLEDILKGYYDVDMMAMQVDQRVFKRLVTEHFPQLASYLEGLGADVSCVFVQWFLCVFVNFLPIEACLRVWDALFYYRSPTVLFKTALALLEVFQPALSCCSDVLDALDLLQTMAPLTYDSNRLISRAFGPSFEAVTDLRLATLRREYREEVEAEAAALAEELAWEASASSAGPAAANTTTSSASASSQPGSQQQQQQQQQQPSNSRISVLKMIARGVKEKFGGVGGAVGGGGTGANSVERAASPVPEVSLPASVSSVALGGSNIAPAPASGGGGDGDGSEAAAAGAEEPLLIRSSQPFEGGGIDADSEDYHRLNGDDGFQYEQVGYVAPSDLSETAGGGGGGGAAAVGGGSLELLSSSLPVPPLPPLPYSHCRTAIGCVNTAAASVAVAGYSGVGCSNSAPQQQQLQRNCTKPTGMTESGHGDVEVPAEMSAHNAAAAGVTTTSAGHGDDPLKALLEVASGIASALQPAAAAAADDGDGGDRRRQHRSASAYMWHETPKWTSSRALSATVTGRAVGMSSRAGSAAVFAAPAAGTVAASPPQLPASFVPRPPSPGGAAPAVAAAAAGSSGPPVVPSSPHVLMITADRSQPLTAGLVAGGEGDGGDADDGDDDDHRLAGDGGAAAAVDELISSPRLVFGSENHPAAAAAAVVAGVVAAAPHGSGTGSGTAAPHEGAVTSSDFSQVQAADQARRAQGSKRRCSKAASLAWEIALAPLRMRQKIQQQQNEQHQQQNEQQTQTQQQIHPQHYPQQLQQAHPSQPLSAAAVGAASGSGDWAHPQAATRPPPRSASRGSMADAALQDIHTAVAGRGGPTGGSAAPSGIAGAVAALPEQQHQQQQQISKDVYPDQASGSGQQWQCQAPMGSTTLPPPPQPPQQLLGTVAASTVAAPRAAPSDVSPSVAMLAAVAAGHGSGPQPPDAHIAVTPSAAIPLVAPCGGGGGGAATASHAPPHPHLHFQHHNHHIHHNTHQLPSGGVGGGAATGMLYLHGGGGGTAMSSLHAPPGSSFASTCSVSMLDEHRDASPAEARDEWVIMSAPSDGVLPQPSPSRRHPSPLPPQLPPPSSSHCRIYSQQGPGSNPADPGYCSYGGMGAATPGALVTAAATAAGIPTPGPLPSPRGSAAGGCGGGGGGGSSGSNRYGSLATLGPAGVHAHPGTWPYTQSHNANHFAAGGGGDDAMAHNGIRSGGDCMGATAAGDVHPSSTAAADMVGGVWCSENSSELRGPRTAPVSGVAAGAGAKTATALDGLPTAMAATATTAVGVPEEWRPVGSSSGGSGGIEAGGPAVQELRESLGVADLIRHHSALTAKLRRLKKPPPPPAWPSAPPPGPSTSSGEDVRTDGAGDRGEAAVGSGDTSPPPLATEPIASTADRRDVPCGDGDVGVGCGRPSLSLGPLAQLQHLQGGLAATAQANAAAAAAAGATSASAAAAAAAALPPLSASIAAAVGGGGGSGLLLPEGLLPLPYASAAQPTPAVTPFDQLVVGPGGQVRLQSAAAPPPPPSAATAAALIAAAGLAAVNGPFAATAMATATAGAPSSVAQSSSTTQQQQQQETLREAAGVCCALSNDFSNLRTWEAEAADLLEQYGVLSEVLAARLDELVQQLAEKQYTIEKLSSKLDQTMKKYAAQDTVLADKDYAIRHLQIQLQGGPPTGAAAGGGSGGGSGMGTISGLSSALGFGGGTAAAVPPLSGQATTAAAAAASNGTSLLRRYQGAVGGTGASGGYGGGGGGGGLVPGAVHNFLIGGGIGGSSAAGAAAAANGGRHSSPQRGGGGSNQNSFWQFSKNLKARFAAGKDDQQQQDS